MKRFLFGVFIIMFLICVGSSNALANWGKADNNDTGNGYIDLSSTAGDARAQLSSGVYAGYSGTDTAYGAGTVNKNGTQSYGTSSASSTIYYHDVSVNTTTPTEVSAGQSSWASDTWTAIAK